MKPFIRVMKALSDPNRVRILKLLAVQDLCVCELQALIGLAQSTVSKHLKVLEDAGFVDYQKDGAWIIYRLAPTETVSYATTMLSHLQSWLEDDPDLQAMKKRLPDIDRIRICQNKSLPHT